MWFQNGPGLVLWSGTRGKMYCDWGGKRVFCLLWGEPGRTRFGVGCRFPNRARTQYVGFRARGKFIAVGVARASAACCGVNLGARILGLGVGSKMGPGRYFGVERRGNCIAVGVARASAACYGVNLGARGFGVGLWVPKIPKWAWDTVRWFQGKGKMYCSWSGGSVFCLLWGEPGGTRFWGWVWVPKIPKWAWNTVRWFQGKGKMYCSWSGGSVFCLLWSEPGSPDWVLAADRSSTMGRAWYFGVGHGWGEPRRAADREGSLLLAVG